MDPILIIGIAAVGLVVLAVIGVMRMSQMTRLSVPDHPLWPPVFFYPDRSRQSDPDAPATGEFRITPPPKAPHSGIPVGNAPMTNIPTNWGQNDGIPEGTMAFMPAAPSEVPPQNLPSIPRGIPVTRETNPNAAAIPPYAQETQISSINVTSVVRHDNARSDAPAGTEDSTDNKADDDNIDLGDKKTSQFPRPRA